LHLRRIHLFTFFKASAKDAKNRRLPGVDVHMDATEARLVPVSIDFGFAEIVQAAVYLASVATGQ